MEDEPLRHLFIIEPKIKGAVSKLILTQRLVCGGATAGDRVIADGSFHEHVDYFMNTR